MESHYKKTLYALTKNGNTKSWDIEVRGQTKRATITVISRAGEGYKPIVRNEEIIVGKNIGRSNETTPLEQAISEAESRYNEKLREGYTEKKPKKGATSNTNSLGFKPPMLAHPIDKVKEITFPAFLQAKLDGHRALVTTDNKTGKLVMYSRKSTVIDTMDHLLKDIYGLLPGECLDGELYIHGKKLQDLASLIKKYRPGESDKIQYWVYDIISPGFYSQRLKRLKEIVTNAPKTQRVNFLPTISVKSLDETQIKTEALIKGGYEGAILRLDGSEYEVGVRSRNLLKIKRFDDTEYKVLDIIPGKATTVNGVDRSPGILICGSVGDTFEVYAPGTIEEKEEILKNKKKYIGKEITIKHSGFTNANKPWHPVALRFRDDI